MVSSKYLKTASKDKGASSSRTITDTASLGKEAKGGTAVPSESMEVVIVSSPEKESKERRVKRKHDSSTQQKEAKKQRTAEEAEKHRAEEEGKQKAEDAEKQKIAEEAGKQKIAEEAGKQKTADTAIVPSSARTNAFMSRCPSSFDLKQLAIPPTVCVEEKKWLASLPDDALHFETSKYFEMARLGYHATTAYCGVLEQKCRSLEGTPMQKSQLTMAQELVRKIQVERDQLQKEKKELMKSLEAKESAIAAQEGVVAEKDKIISRKNKDLKACEKLMSEFKEKVKTLRAESTNKEMEWQGEKRALMHEKQVLTEKISAGEEKLRDIYKSEEFKIRVRESILPHWQQGIRIGVRQAVKTYEGLDARIAYFEPDYEDACGEPDIEDSDEEVESRDRGDPMEINEEAGGENTDAME